MKQRNLGGLKVSSIGLGCMSMSQAYGDADRDESERTLHRALDIGVSFLDTANAYGNGHNETLIGEVLASHRDKFVLATKFGIVRHADGTRGVDGHPDRVAERCEESLKRLQTDVIDLYYLHRLDPQVPIEETVGAMAELVHAGKVRHLGLSEISANTLRRAHAVHPITAVQSEYSLWTRDPEEALLATCKELGVGFVPFSPLGRAIFTGKLRDPELTGDKDLRKTMPRFMGDNFTSNLKLVDEFETFAASLGHTPAQLAIAWVLAQDEDFAPIPGTKHMNYLEEDMAAADIELTAQDITTMSEIFAPQKVAGERYPPALMASIDKS